jgi:hypothetical protein
MKLNQRLLGTGFLLAVVFSIFSGGLGLVWRNKAFRFTLIGVPLLIGSVFLLPGREMDAVALRKSYVKRMSGFEGTRYYWGGEGSRGIDCSGLPRRAYRDALLGEGLRNLNGRALRMAVAHWWFDASAKALMEGHRSYVVPLGISGTVRSVDMETLLPGDLAITADGVHVMVYSGPGKWIQADPGENKVVTLDPGTSENGWFDSRIAMFRWSQLSN